MSRAVLALILSAAFAGPAAAAEATMVAHPVAGTVQPNAAGCHLTYMGGPLIQHVKVVDVFYSPSSAFATGLKANLEAWYAGVTASAHFDMLSEYNVTNYKIGRGTFVMSFEDTHPNPASVTALSDPGAYLKGLLDAHKLPAPDDDTIYQLYFPSHVDPYLQGSPSCISGGGFCAYHNSFSYTAGQMVRYSVMPDTSSGSCAGGCGPAGFSGVCDVSSHELVEAVTDPDGNGSWVDFTSSCGEIGDICAGGANETGTIPGTSFIVQKEWSNALNACAVNNPAIVVNDFVLGMPNTVNVQQGGMATTTMTTTKVGMAENVALTSMAPLPTGIVVSFNPASITSDNGMSTITITAAATATLGPAKFTVKATDMAGNSHTQDININVVPPPDMSTLPDLAQGGGGGTGGTGGGGTGGNGNHPNAGGCSCEIGGGGGVGAGWAAAALLLLGLAIRRRRA
jgi:MYXO-CTERM domain-containing protein